MITLTIFPEFRDEIAPLKRGFELRRERRNFIYSTRAKRTASKE
jgi:hypothetical protein